MEAIVAMRSKWVKVGAELLCGVGLALGAGCPIQGQGTVPSGAIGAELEALASHAGIVFVGQIVSIEHKGSVVEVKFRVERPIRGSVASTFVMREWSGLWPAGHVRYTVGARVLAFVNGASGAGLSSPVHGAEGLVPVVVGGVNAPQLLDVRRVAASVVRAPGTSLPTEANGAVPLSEALGWINAPGNAPGNGKGLLPVPTRGRKPVWEQGSGPNESGSGPGSAPVVTQPEPGDGSRGPRALPILQEVSHDLR